MTLSVACDGRGPLQVGEATLAVIVLGFDELPKDADKLPQVVVMPGQPVTVPDAPVVKLAVDRLVSWGQVKAIVDLMEARDQKPIFLIAKRSKIKAFHLNDELEGEVVQVYAETEGKICVSHPEVREAKCQQTLDKKYLDPSFTRELVREAINGYERSDVIIDLPDALIWGDVVSAVGGARSCCGDQTVRVHISED